MKPQSNRTNGYSSLRRALFNILFLLLLPAFQHSAHASPAEHYLTTEFSEYLQLLHTVSNSQVIDFQDKGCGHKHALLTFHNGFKACAKYNSRLEYARGALYFYHLNRRWGLQSTAAITLVKVDFNASIWQPVRSQLNQAGWREHSIISLSPYYPNLEEVHLPLVFQGNDDITLATMQQSPDLKAPEYSQWSDLIAMDYLAGESDRLSFFLINRQWNEHIYEHTAINLFRRIQQLFLLDNDHSFGAGYSMARHHIKLADFQQHYIDKLCYFNPVTIEGLCKLNLYHNPLLTVENAIREYDKASLELVGVLTAADRDQFQQRLVYVLQRATYCAN